MDLEGKVRQIWIHSHSLWIAFENSHTFPSDSGLWFLRWHMLFVKLHTVSPIWPRGFCRRQREDSDAGFWPAARVSRHRDRRSFPAAQERCAHSNARNEGGPGRPRFWLQAPLSSCPKQMRSQQRDARSCRLNRPCTEKKSMANFGVSSVCVNPRLTHDHWVPRFICTSFTLICQCREAPISR